MFLLFWALLLLLSLLSYDANDPSLNHVVSAKNAVQNKVGLFGAYASGFLNDVFGIAALLWPLVFAALGAAYISARYCFHWWRWCGFFLLTICFMVLGSAWDLTFGDLSGGGMVGSTLYKNSALYLSPVGSGLLWFFVLLVGMQLAFNISWITLAEKGLAKLAERFGTQKTEPAPGPADSQNQPFDLRKMASPAKLIGLGNEALRKIRSFGDGLRQKFEEIKARASAQKEARAAQEIRDTFRQNDVPEDPALKIIFDPEEESRFDDAGGDKGSYIPETGNQPCKSDIEKRPDEGGQKPYEPEVAENSDEWPGEMAEEPEEMESGPEPQAPVAEARPFAEAKSRPLAQAAPVRHTGPLELPSLDLLLPPKPLEEASTRQELEDRGRKLMVCLGDFDIQGELVRITPGPVVTRFEIRPAAGVKVKKISGLSDDISRALSAVAVRVQAPIPGRDTVGIEIPNDHRQVVNFREIAASEEFQKGCGPLTMILGKDIAGKPYMADLSKMPHLLVAGATGAGKSVCLNCILVSLLYKLKPENTRLLLVDPKRIEMALYTDVPHLVHPVVTEMSDAKNALDWAVNEMDRRYHAIARLGGKNVTSYNQKLASFKGNIPDIFSDLEPMPYLVIVIDELADLMMTASKEVETNIVRLAQLARAAGIHLIVATQRPSVDVVTGLIKANFPSRLSFRVTSKHDSRTILDEVGAEHLLGSGDMLFKPSGGNPIRLHGPFLSDDECAAVVSHWKNQLAPDYKIDFSKWTAESDASQTESSGPDATRDPLYNEIREFVLNHGQASISLLQRQFSIGFGRAGRIIAQFEREGLIGPPDGSKPRQVIR